MHPGAVLHRRHTEPSNKWGEASTARAPYKWRCKKADPDPDSRASFDRRDASTATANAAAETMPTPTPAGQSSRLIPCSPLVSSLSHIALEISIRDVIAHYAIA